MLWTWIRVLRGARYVLGAFRQGSDLRRWGPKLVEPGGKSAKKRAEVAVARKLALLLHHLWFSGELYEPLRNNRQMVGTVA
jgi:transposase